MKRIREWIRNLSIRKKLIFYSYAVITPILLIISILLFINNYMSAVENEENNSIQSVLRLSDSIEVLQKNIMEMGTYICINDQITKILTSENPEELNKDAQIWLHQGPMQIIQDMMALDGQIKTIAIYPENGVNPFLRCMDYSAYIGDAELVHEQEIYKLAAENKGKFLWQRVGKFQSDTYLYNRKDKIVMYREIYDLTRRNKLGYLIIGSSAELFDKTCRNSLSDSDESIIVMSEYGAELVRCGNIDDEFLTEILSQQFEQNIGRDGTSSNLYKGNRVILCKSEETGTIIYKIAPKVSMQDLADNIIYAPLALLLGILIGLYPIMILVSNIVTKPLHNLSAAMDRFKRGDFSQKIEVDTSDEVGEVTACFNSMVDDIRDLINENYVMALKEREIELDTLQAQINPHFLYNTLDSLYWKALESGNEEIGEDILSLSQLFRLVLNRGDGIVRVKLEAELLECYLHIQKMRFGKRLEYKIELDNSILEEEIPKLILQPFVENAIVHGFEKGGKDFTLTINGKRDKENLTFLVMDTGVGMSREQLEAIWDRSDTKEYASQRIGRYAIKNVKERLELLYKDSYELVIESKEGHGTTVKISIPCGSRGIHRYEQKTVDRG